MNEYKFLIKITREIYCQGMIAMNINHDIDIEWGGSLGEAFERVSRKYSSYEILGIWEWDNKNLKWVTVKGAE